jgi:hypothetical protein
MEVSAREKNILILAAVVAVIFAVSSGFPALRDLYQQRQENIEAVQIDISREQRLIEDMLVWRERRVEVETMVQQLEAQIFSGGTVAIIEANIQRVISQHARDSGITVSSTRLADRLDTKGWLLISQEMSFRTSDDGNTIDFLEKLESSTPQLWVSDFSLNRSRNQYNGSITVVGFARSEDLGASDVADSR